MNAKRILSLFLAAVLTLGVAVTPAVAASAAPALPGSAALEESNGPVSIKLTASGPLVYGSPFELVVETRPAETQYLGVVLGTKGEAKGFVTLVFSDKIRTLLKMIPLPKRMSATPDQTTDFNLYSYIKQLIDGNDVEVLLRVADEVASVMDALQFYIPTIKDVSTGLRLALEMIRKEAPAAMTVEEARSFNAAAVVESDGQVIENGKVTYSYKKKSSFFGGTPISGFPTEPGTYTQTAKAAGNYSSEKITRTIVIN